MERAKIGENPLKVLRFCTVFFDFNKYKQKRGTSEKKDGNCHVLANSRQAILPCLLLADGWNLGFPIPSKNCPEAIQQPLGISRRLSNTLLAVPSSCPITLRAFPSGYWLKPSNFSPFSLKGRFSDNIYLKSKEHWKILKTTSGSSPTIELSNNIAFSRSQSRATVPLSLKLHLPRSSAQ